MCIRDRQEGVRLGRKRRTDHADDDLVGYQTTGIHVALRLKSKVRAVLDLLTKQVAGGQMQQVQLLLQALSLGALAGTGGTEECEACYFKNPSYWRWMSCDSS